MKVPLKWLDDYVDIKVNPKEFADAMTMSGSKVEGLETQGEEISKVVVGKILSLEKHPDADKLQVSRVDVGNGEIQVVTGAQNVKVGDYIPVALDGSTLPGGKKIAKGKLRGVESNGMMCSIQELGITPEDYPDTAEHGIFILDGTPAPGQDIKEVLGMNDTVVEFEITPNRPDCLSIVGIAREAAVTLGARFIKPGIVLREEGSNVNDQASVEIIDAELCPRYAARVVSDVKIGPSPKWMKDRLKAAGVRPINNIVDITNYVMLELGQPMHAFDFDKLKGGKIIVRRAAEGDVLKTLDGQERQLESYMLVIADAQRPVAVAGVMGGANSEVDESTTSILFESANFNGTSVRLAAKRLNMRTEASGRFEKGLDPENVLMAVDRAAQLVEELNAGKVCKGAIDRYVKKADTARIALRPEKINSLLGTDISADKIKGILESLGFEVDKANNQVTVPSYRQDVEGEADLAEEVARFHGYNNIEASLLKGKTPTIGRKTYKQKAEDIIKNTMISCGLYEAYTYSFVSPKVYDRINLPDNSELRMAVEISNPLGEDYSIMRTTTIPDMLEVISRNYNRRIEDAGLFELSYVYLPERLPVDRLPNEKEVLTIGMYGNKDFYDLKGVLEELFDVLGIKDYELEPEKSFTPFHPGRTAKVFIGGKPAGIIGEVHPEVVERYRAPEKTYMAVIDVEPLVSGSDMLSKYTPLPRYPAVTRDIAMLVKEDILSKRIEGIIRSRAGDILEEIRFFDVYKGKQVPEGMKSIAYSITFRAEDRTLTDEEATKTMDNILEGLKSELEAQLR